MVICADCGAQEVMPVDRYFPGTWHTCTNQAQPKRRTRGAIPRDAPITLP